MENRLKKRDVHNKIIAWSLCFALILACELIYKNALWTCDAFDYWARGENFKNTMFNLSANNGFRGYIFPLYLGVINCIGGKIAWYIINAIVFSAFFTMIIPNIGADYEYTKRNTIKILIADITISVLFVGLLAYPLSDLFALLCCCMSVIFARKSFEYKNFKRYMSIFFMGVFGYWAYNTRTIYLFALILLFGVYVIKDLIHENRRILTFGKCILSIVGGGCASIPQIIMNYRNLGKIYLGVPTEGLMLQQMFWGIEYQRYDTYIPQNVDVIHPNPQVYFVDPTGMKILNELGLPQFNTWGDFLRVFLSHPIDVMMIYARHFINFLFPCWPQMYVDNLNSTKWLLGLMGASIIFLTLFVFLNKCIINYKSIIYYLPLLVPGVLIIPGAVEYRFSLPLYFFGISQLCFNVDYSKVKKIAVNKKVKLLVVYLIFVLMCFVAWSNMLANESVLPLYF